MDTFGQVLILAALLCVVFLLLIIVTLLADIFSGKQRILYGKIKDKHILGEQATTEVFGELVNVRLTPKRTVFVVYIGDGSPILVDCNTKQYDKYKIGDEITIKYFAGGLSGRKMALEIVE